MQPAIGSRRDQVQPAQPDRAPAEQQRRSKSNGNQLPPLQPGRGSDLLAMIRRCQEVENDLRPAQDLQPHALEQRLCHGQSTAVPAGMVHWAAARQHRMQRVHSAAIPTKGHSRQPVGVDDCVLGPANLVSTQSRNRTRAHPCSRYSLLPWREPGNSTYRLAHKCGYTQHL